MTDLQPTTKVEIVATSLRSVWEDRGRLVPEDLVEVAAEDTHPLHDFFEWNDGEAAHKYRVMQARQLIMSVKVLVTASTNGDPEDFQIREWVAARSVGAGRGSYVPQEVVVGNPDQQARLLRQMRRDLAAIERRYKHQEFYYREIARLTIETDTAGAPS